MDTSDTPMRYAGPLDLAHAHTKLNHVVSSEGAFTRDGPRADNEYRDLGLAAASGGRIGAKHIRAIKPFEQPTGWHWHDMTGHFVVILKGWITFRFAGVEGDVTVQAGSCLSRPAGAAQNSIARWDALGLTETNIPPKNATQDPGGAGAPAHRG